MNITILNFKPVTCSRLAIHRSRVGVLAEQHCVVALGKLLTPFVSITKQYNLLLAKGVISLAGKVIVGLVKSNGSLPPDL